MFYDHARSAPVSSPYGTPAEPKTPEPPRRHRVLRLGFLSWLLPVLGVVGLVVFMPYAGGAGPDIAVGGGSGFAVVEGAEVALVPYDRHGGDFLSDMFQVRLAAVDLADGETVWDEQIAEGLSLEARVLAAGEEYAYLATGDGLVIVELADGDVAVEPDEIDGLGESFLAGTAAYGYDEATESVVVLAREGDVRAIPVDSATAEPAEPDAAARWSKRLSPDSPTFSVQATESEALLAPDRVIRLRPVNGGTGSVLTVVTDSGLTTVLGDEVFYEATVVPDQTQAIDHFPRPITATARWQERSANSVDADTATVAGVTASVVMVRHKKSASSDAVELSVVSLDTGEVRDSITSAGPPGAAVCRPDGTTLIPISGESDAYQLDRLAVVDPFDGIEVFDIGDPGPLGGL